MARIDETHNPKLRSWVASANGHPDFPIQNLPLGVFTPPGGGAAQSSTGRAEATTGRAVATSYSMT